MIFKLLRKALDEIKTLKGIQPLCPFCKKIRNEEGEWEQVETYVHKHFQTDITHSVCPVRKEIHYPERI